MEDSETGYDDKLSHADDRVRLSEWIPQQWGVPPRIRFPALVQYNMAAAPGLRRVDDRRSDCSGDPAKPSG
jgi:hypothetical protein